MPESGNDEEAPEPVEAPPVEPDDAPVADKRSLARDLDEVRRGNPERAFNIGAALGVLVTVAAFIFVLQNNQSTTFDWLWFDFELPLWTALVGAVVVGVVLVLTILAVRASRRRRIESREGAAGRLRQALTRDRRSPADPHPA
jgi:uncharacterized integral membrane protein